MTVKELSQYYFLGKELEQYDRRIDELRARRVAISAPAFDKEPGGQHDPTHSKIETLTAEIIELEDLMRINREKRALERQRLERYIEGIQDSAVRQIARLRFADLKSWNEVGSRMGAGYTVDALKKMLYRYLEKHPDD